MSLQVSRPVDPSLHPLVTGNYRIATPAIESFYELVVSCLRYRVTGALIYGAPRIGKTRSIEYVRLLLAREYPKVTSYHARCEHKPRHAEGPFFSNLLEAVGDHDPNAGTNPAKRMRLLLRIREAAARAGSGTVRLFCDEAQRYNENEYEWLRDVHDALDRQQIKLFTFLVGQQELLSQKSALQIAGKTQIVARLMVEELAFHGIRNAEDVATCLNGYDQTAYPEGTQWSFTRFYLPQAFDAGCRLVNDAALLWNAFEAAHHKATLAGRLEIPMNRLRGPSRSCSRIANSGMLRGIVRTPRYGPTLCGTPAMFSRAMQPVACLSTRKEAPALIAPRFPILSLDERRLTPALGFIFDARWLLPSESIVSILWKFARANGLPGHALVRLMGADIDPYEGVEPMRDAVDVKHLRRTLLLPGKVLHASLLDAGQRGRHHPVFRYCRQCVLLGHHSVTYQMFSENRCPAHQRKLETQCHRCGRETPYILNASLVGSPYRCAQCGELYATQSPPAFAAKPAMRKEHRIAIARHFYNRMAGSFCLGVDDRVL